MSLRKPICISLVLALLVCLTGGCDTAEPSRVVYTTRSNSPTASSTDAITPAEPSDTATIARADSILVDVQPVSQYPDYPTGCESVTAVMALHYAGIPIGIEAFIENHLPCDDRFYEEDGVLYGPDPYAVFVGDPRRAESYGCMAPVIEQALRSCVGEQREVINTTGEALSALCHNYIDKGIPVMMWATMEMRSIGIGGTWLLPDGTSFTWPTGEHCLLLIGYNENAYIFNDPRYDVAVAYDKKSVEMAYAALGKQSLVIQ